MGFKNQLQEKNSLWQNLQNCRKPIVLYGMGDGAEKIIYYLQGFGLTPAAVFASDDFVRGQSFLGYRVQKYSDVKNFYGEFVVLVAFGTQRPEVIANILKVAAEQETYAPNVPLFGEGLFDYDYLLRYEHELERVYNNLADEKSRQTFLDFCDYSLSGKIDYLMDCTIDKAEAVKLLNLSQNEVYLDLGAYNGDTVREFIELTHNRYQKILAVEPDGKNFVKLQKNTLEYPEVSCLNYGVWREQSRLFFNSKAGRNSSLVADGSKSVECLSIDDIQNKYPANKISLIKMDVEGAEKQALEGAAKTLGEQKPKMLVSAYHRNEDLFLLPDLIWKSNPRYEIYLRHHLYIPAWETNFYCI